MVKFNSMRNTSKKTTVFKISIQKVLLFLCKNGKKSIDNITPYSESTKDIVKESFLFYTEKVKKIY